MDNKRWCEKCKKRTDNMGIFLTLDENRRPVNMTSCYKCCSWKKTVVQIEKKTF